MHEVSARDFGATGDGVTNDRPALQAAARSAIESGADRLIIPPGRYLLSDPDARALQDRVLSGELGNPEPELFLPGYDYRRGLDLTGARDLTVDAAGAQFVVDGWLEALTLTDVERVAIRGLSIDFLRPPNSEGTVGLVGETTIRVDFPDRFPVGATTPFLRVMGMRPGSVRLFSSPGFASTGRAVGDGSLEFASGASDFAVGDRFLGWHGFHFRPAILIYRSSGVMVEDVTIHANAGMGVVGHLSADVTLRRLRVVPRPGSVLSTNTDATHFVSCRGLLRFEDCEFQGHGDDATNVHGIYFDASRLPGRNRVRIALAPGCVTHSVLPDVPEPGDVFAVVDPSSLAVRAHVTAVAVRQEGYESVLDLAEEMPQGEAWLINLSACPRLEFVRSTVRGNRARGVLIKTRGALVEESTFEGCTGTAIHVGAEAWWREGPASCDVVISSNRIADCGYGDGAIEGTVGVAVHVQADREDVPGLHRRILVSGNTIEGKGRAAILVASADDVVVSDNAVSGVDLAVEVRDSTAVVVREFGEG